MMPDLNPKLISKVVKRGQGGLTVLALFVFAMVTASAPREARAAAGEHGVGLGFGQVLLMGDFATNFNSSLGLNLSYSYEASALFGLLTNLSISSHSNAAGNNSLSIKGLTPDLRINLAYIDKLVVYAFTGLGLFSVSETIASSSASSGSGAAATTGTGSVTTLGFNLGTAVNLALDKHFQFGTQLNFQSIFGKTDAASGLSIGGTYMGLMLNIMYIF